MNAGAYGYETSDYLEKINTVIEYGKIKNIPKKKLKCLIEKHH